VRIRERTQHSRGGVSMKNLMKAYIGNPVHLVMKGFDGSIDRLFGIMFQNGRRLFFRTGRHMLEINMKDIVEVAPFQRSKNYFKEALRAM
jgi:hypothetical protein